MIIVLSIHMYMQIHTYVCRYICIYADVIALFGGIYDQCVSEFLNALRLLVVQLFGVTSDQFAGITYSKSMPDGNRSIYSRLDKLHNQLMTLVDTLHIHPSLVLVAYINEIYIKRNK